MDWAMYDYEHLFSIISCSVMLQTIAYIVCSITRVSCVHVTDRVYCAYVTKTKDSFLAPRNGGTRNICVRERVKGCGQR